MNVTFTLNGRRAAREIAPDETLLTLLRRCGVHSVRGACDTASCGVCTVWVDGVPTLSCAFPAARVEGRSVTTVEGAGEDAKAVMNAFAAQGADQCGFCSPGLIMTVLALLRDLPDPSDAEIDAYLAGNLCRCSGYMSQRRAVRALIEGRRGK